MFFRSGKFKVFSKLLLLTTFFILSGSCSIERTISENLNNAPDSQISTSSISDSEKEQNVFDRFLNAEYEPADGFDFPVGNANGKNKTDWFITTQFAENYDRGIYSGENWTSNDKTNIASEKYAFATANGRVVVAENFGDSWGNVIILEHIFYENNEKRKIRSVYAHLQAIKVKIGEIIKRRQVIASLGQDSAKSFSAHLYFEMRWDETLPPTYSADGKDADWIREHYAAPSAFINSHRKLFVPQKEKTLVLVDQKSYKMRLYENGERQGEYEVSFGQSKGAKQIEGDNKTPVGMYFVIEKHRGKFDGDYGAYYGGHWIKINYPNIYDGRRGLAEKLIDSKQAEAIKANWSERKATSQNTKLGNGIGFHGWIREWENDGSRHLSWGCVVMHIYDISKLYDRIQNGAMIVIF